MFGSLDAPADQCTSWLPCTAVAKPLEQFLSAAVLYRLDTPELSDVLAGRSSTDECIAGLTRDQDEARSSW